MATKLSLGLSELQSTHEWRGMHGLETEMVPVGGGFVASTSGLRARSGMIGVQALATSGRCFAWLAWAIGAAPSRRHLFQSAKEEKEVNDGCPYPRPLQKNG